MRADSRANTQAIASMGGSSTAAGTGTGNTTIDPVELAIAKLERSHSGRGKSKNRWEEGVGASIRVDTLAQAIAQFGAGGGGGSEAAGGELGSKGPHLPPAAECASSLLGGASEAGALATHKHLVVESGRQGPPAGDQPILPVSLWGV